MGIDLWFQTNISASRPPILKVKVLKWPPIWGICFNAKKIRLSSWTGWENPEKPSFLNYIYRELLSHNWRTVLFVTFRTFLATCAHAQLQITPSIQSCLKLQMSTESLKSMLTILFYQTIEPNRFNKPLHQNNPDWLDTYVWLQILYLNERTHTGGKPFWLLPVWVQIH